MILLVLSLFSVARAGGDGMGAASALTGGRFAEIATELELTEAQRTAVSDAVYASNGAKIEVEARADRARLELRHQLGAAAVDEKATLKTVDALSAAEGELRRNRVQLVLTLRKTLSAAQWAELSSIRPERREERQEERGEEREDD